MTLILTFVFQLKTHHNTPSTQQIADCFPLKLRRKSLFCGEFDLRCVYLLNEGGILE